MGIGLLYKYCVCQGYLSYAFGPRQKQIDATKQRLATKKGMTLSVLNGCLFREFSSSKLLDPEVIPFVLGINYFGSANICLWNFDYSVFVPRSCGYTI